MSRKVPVTVVTGFLGSGKSTLLNHILTDPSTKDKGLKFAVIENELGSVSIDNHLLAKNIGDEEIIEVTNGCICCSIRSDLLHALNNLYDKVIEKNLDGILLETSGLADPSPIIQTFFQDGQIAEKFRLDGVVTVVDAKHILDRLGDEKQEGAVNEAAEQIAFADRILLNKIDLVEGEEKLSEIEDVIKDINPAADIMRTKDSKVKDSGALLNVGGFDIARALEMDANFMTTPRLHKKDKRISSIAYQVSGDVHFVMLEQWMQQIIQGNSETGDAHNHDHEEKTNNEGTMVYRYKGILSIKGYDQKYVFQGVGMVFAGYFAEEVWEDEDSRVNSIVLIGKDLKKRELIDSFEACIIPDEPLRFAIGTQVEANVGSYKLGKIVSHWDEGRAYRVQLDHDGSDVWAPLDMDSYVRLPP